MLPTPSLADRFALDVQGAQALRAGAKEGDAEALRKAAKEFEAMMVNVMLKTMRETKFSDRADDPFNSDSVRMYQELLDQQWARKVTDAKGLGLAEALVRQLQAQQGALSPENASRIEPPKEGLPIQRRNEPQPLHKADPVHLVPARDEPAKAMPVPMRGPDSQPMSKDAADSPRRAFIDRMRPYAEAAAQATGVPTEYILAHAALESGWGRREIVGEDGRNSHNLFGIKAGGAWKGDAVEITTTEYRYGLPMKRSEPFRAYAGYAEGFADYAELLKRRYADALQGDAATFAERLQKGGYATDPNYASKLQGVMASLGRVSG